MTTKQSDVHGEHEVKMTVEVDIYYPDHVQRTESSLFHKNKHYLIQVMDTPCWCCGSKEHREVHHKILEWADSEGVDWNHMQALYPDFPEWKTCDLPTGFVDHLYNLQVLCMECHRGKGRGIHFLPYPIWLMQRHKRADFVMFKDEVNTLKGDE